MGWTIGMPSLKLNLNGEKSKHCGGFYQVAAEALQERAGHDPDINPELSDKNIYLGYQTAAELMAYSEAHCAGLKDASGRSLRADAVRMCVTIIKPPAAMMASLSEEKQKQFLDDGIEKLKEIVGKDNVKSLAYHFDEQGAHVHVFWEPITKDGRLCAKDVHNLKFLSRLNKEMPQYLRECGWDIDDCNAYDQAKESLLSEKEKAERRQQRGRSSSVFKADAERKLNEINQQIDWTFDHLEERLEDCLRQSIENVVNDESNIYDNFLFLMSECDDKRFTEIDQEGRELKKKTLQEISDDYQKNNNLNELIENINSRKQKSISWETRQLMWEAYKVESERFWKIRSELKEDYQRLLSEAYQKRRDAMRSYYDALYFLRRSRGFIGLFTALVWISISNANQKRAEQQIQALKEDHKQLCYNTASFKKFSTAYREELKAGKMPFEKHLESMTAIVQTLDEEATKFRDRGQVKRRDNNIEW